jgi:hypothetical protein
VNGPILIVGTMRSGSTLLRLMLDRHEHISIGPESGFMGIATAVHDVPGWRRGERWYAAYGATAEQVDAHIRDLVEDVLGGYAAARGRHRWGDKTPFHVWHLQRMTTLFPDASLLAIVRHPAATLVSTRRWRYTAEDAISKWVRANAEIIHRAVELGSRMAVVRYEDLVLHPDATLGSVLGFLDEPWSEHLLDPTRSAEGVVEGGTRADDPLDPGRVDAWTAELTDVERSLLHRRVPRSLLDILGYELDRPRPVAHAPGLLPLDDVDTDALPAGGKLASGAFDPERERLNALDREELIHRLLKAERRRSATRARWMRGLRRSLFSRHGEASPSTGTPQGGRR